MASRLSLLMGAAGFSTWTSKKIGDRLAGLWELGLVKRSDKRYHNPSYWSLAEKGRRYLELSSTEGNGEQEGAAP